MRLRSFFHAVVSMFFLTALITGACTPDSGGSDSQNSGSNDDPNNGNECTTGDVRCTIDNTIERCSNGTWVIDESCTGSTPFCDPAAPEAGCLECVPGGSVCVGDEIHECNSDGTIGEKTELCDPAAGAQCMQIGDKAVCDGPCRRAAANHDYQGCDYWAVTMFNPTLSSAFDSDFGIVVANGNDSPVTVTIEKGGNTVTSGTVDPNSAQVFLLPYDQEVKESGRNYGDGVARSMLKETGAYHVTTTLPVTVYQFNPYDFTIGQSYSYSNDGSLLLPTPVLSTNYIVMSRQPLMATANSPQFMAIPGAITIVGTENDTSVTIKAGGRIQGSLDSSTIPDLEPGETLTVTIDRGEVLQLIEFTEDLAGSSSCPGQESTDSMDKTFCDPGASYDLTGTEITSTRPIAVWGGHGCAYVPFDSQACDHLEEMIPPLETWGKEFIVATTQAVDPQIPESRTNVIRILSGADGVNVSFDPAGVHEDVTLDRGEYVEFMTTEDFAVTATGPIMVGQFTVGQNYWTDVTQGQIGDPAFGLVVPMEQYRTSYVFSAPSSFEAVDPYYGASGQNYMNVYLRYDTDNMTTGILFDGQPLETTPEPIGSSGWSVIRTEIAAGSHTIESTNGREFGIMVYGFAPYTSYLYPGGLDLEYINPVD